MGDRDPGVGGRGDAGGDPGHDLELDPGLAQRLALLAAAAEDERVAALEPDDALARAGGLDQALVDLLLRHRRWHARAPCRRRRARRPRGRRRARPAGSGGRGRSRRRRRSAPASAPSSAPGRRARRRPGRRPPPARSRAPLAALVGACRRKAQSRRCSSARSRISRAPAPSRRSASSAPSRVGSVESPSSRSRIHSLPSGRPTKASIAHPAGRRGRPWPWTPSGLLQVASEQRDDGALGGQLAQRRPVGRSARRRAQRRLVAGAGLQDAATPWPAAGVIVSAGIAKDDLVLAAQPAQAGDGEHDRVELALGELAQPGVDVAVQLARPAGPAARRAAGRGAAGSRSRPGRPPAPRRARTPTPIQASAGVLARRHRGEHQALGQLGRHVLGRVDADVGLARRAAPARPRARSAPCRPARRRRRPRPARRRPASRRPAPPGPGPGRCRGCAISTAIPVGVKRLVLFRRSPLSVATGAARKS